MNDKSSKSGRGPLNWRKRQQNGANRQDETSDADDVQEPDFSTGLITVLLDPEQPPLRSLPNIHGELLRKLRTELLLRHGYHNTSSLAFAVVSTTTGDGRSLLAAELALSFAQLGRSTLLIDADLRSPRQHRLFGTEVMEGLAQTLATGEMPRLNSVEGIPPLSVLAAGDDTGYNPTELFSNLRFQRTLDSMRNLFDFIIVDTPAFNDYSDAQIISTVMGRVLTLHRSKVSNYRDTQAMLDSLARSQVEIFGGVLNQF